MCWMASKYFGVENFEVSGRALHKKADYSKSPLVHEFPSCLMPRWIHGGEQIPGTSLPPIHCRWISPGHPRPHSCALFLVPGRHWAVDGSEHGMSHLGGEGSTVLWVGGSIWMSWQKLCLPQDTKICHCPWTPLHQWPDLILTSLAWWLHHISLVNVSWWSSLSQSAPDCDLGLWTDQGHLWYGKFEDAVKVFWPGKGTWDA